MPHVKRYDKIILLIFRKLNTYMSKLFTLNDNIMATQEAIEKASQVQLDLKIECQKAVFEHTKFLKEQEQMRSEKLQKTNPEIVQWVKIREIRVYEIFLYLKSLFSFSELKTNWKSIYEI